MGCLYSAHVRMKNFSCETKGVTDTIHTQLLYTITIVSEMACHCPRHYSLLCEAEVTVTAG